MNDNNQMGELNRKLQEEENKREKKKIILLLLLLLLLIILIILWTHAIKKPIATLGEKDINQNYTPSPSPTPIPTSTIIENNTIHEITRPITIINNYYTTIIEPIVQPTPTPVPSSSPTPDVNKEFIVSSKNKKWTENLNIFENEKYGGNPIIYPGIENTYKFEFTNEKDFDVECSIKFTETNTENIPIKYKLKENGKYIKGNKSTYVNYDELDTENIIVNANSQNTYELEWKWEESSNDNKYGDTSKTIKYILEITVEANGRLST